MRIPIITKYIERLIAAKLCPEQRVLNNHIARSIESLVKLNMCIDRIQRVDNYYLAIAEGHSRKFHSLTARMDNLESCDRRTEKTFTQLQVALHTRRKEAGELINLAVDNTGAIGDIQNDLKDLRESHGKTLYALKKTVKGLGELYRAKNEQPKKTKKK